MKPTIGLVDCNNFFVSCERLFRPDLLQKPVLVLSSNDGCVVARSQEVKDIGIPMGVPYFKIKDIIKDKHITVFSGNLTLYRDISRRVFEVVRDEFSRQEQYSIDEAFFMFPEDCDRQQVMLDLKKRIFQEVGVPVSVGAATSKTLAKYAAEVAKKETGYFLLSDVWWRTQCKIVPLAQVWGVGRGLIEKYKQAGLHTVSDLLDADNTQVSQLFGVQGVRLQAELRGDSVLTVTNKRPLQKTSMSSRSFRKKTENIAILADAVAYHARHIAADLRSMDAVAGAIRVSLHTSRYGDFLLRGGSRTALLTIPTNDTFSLITQVQALLRLLYEVNVPYHKVSVVVSNVVPITGVPKSLFHKEGADNHSLLYLIDSLNKKVDGKELIVLGSRLKTKDWQSKASIRSGSYTTRWTDLAKVSAI